MGLGRLLVALLVGASVAPLALAAARIGCERLEYSLCAGEHAPALGAYTHQPGLGFRFNRGIRTPAILWVESGAPGRFALAENLPLDIETQRPALSDSGVGLRAAPRTGFGETATPWTEPVRWRFALHASRQLGEFDIRASVGYAHRRGEDGDGFEFGQPIRLLPERSNTLRQAFIGVDASYGINRNWRLHGLAVYRREDLRGPMSVGLPAYATADRGEKEWALGVRYFGWRNFKLNVEFSKTSGRDHWSAESLMFTGRYNF